MPKTIGNPLSWTMGALGSAAGYATVVAAPAREHASPVTRRLTIADLTAALRKGWEDLAAMRSDVKPLAAAGAGSKAAVNSIASVANRPRRFIISIPPK